MNKDTTFNEYLSFLRESMQNLAQYWRITGNHHPHIQDICEGLHHQDPFIIYRASIAATILLGDSSIYH